MIRQIGDLESLKHIVFRPPARRRDGSGTLAEKVVFSGYEVAWKEHEFTAIIATVRLSSLSFLERDIESVFHS